MLFARILAATASGCARRPGNPFGFMLAKATFTCAALLGMADVASATPPAVPDLIHYRFDETGTTISNHASAPPVGSETAEIMGSTFAQGAPYNGFVSALIANATASGNTDYVDTHWAPDLAGAWTISFFTSDVPPSATLYYIFGDINSGQLRCFTNGVAGPGNWILRGPFTDVTVTGGATVAPHMITFVYDPATADIKAYLDAALVSTVAQPLINITGTGPLKVGSYATNIGLNGKMADFRIYRRALDPAEILDIYTYVTLETPMTVDVAVDNDVSCNGGSDGSLTATPTGGIGPYTYLWSNGAATATASGLAAGSYDVTVTDDFGQSGTASEAVMEPSAIVFGTTVLPSGTQGITYVTSLAASGGTGPLTHTLASGSLPAGITLAADGTLSGVPDESGTFDFTVSATDANACLADQAYTLDVNPSLAAAITAQTDISCHGGSNGSLTVTPSGGQPPYTYDWPQTGDTGATASGLAAGTHAVIVTDANASTAIATATLVDPPAIVFDDTPLPPAYLLVPYTASIVATGGTGALAYAVSQGALPPDLVLAADGLLSGTPTAIGPYAFHVAATDANACGVEHAYAFEVGEDPDVIFRNGFEG